MDKRIKEKLVHNKSLKKGLKADGWIPARN